MSRAAKVAWLAVGALFAVIVLACAAGGQTPGDKFERDCRARGGHVQTTHRGDSTSRICVPDPHAMPHPLGWS